MEENTWIIEGYSDYPFNDTHFTVGNATGQIDNYATFHNAPGDRDKGGCNLVFVDGHVEFLPRVTDLDYERRRFGIDPGTGDQPHSCQ